MVMGGVMGGAASILFWCAAVRRPQAWSGRRSGALVRAPLSAATPVRAWGAGARGVQVQLHPPPPRRDPFWGRGGVPSAPGGRRVAPVALKLGGGSGRGGWGGRSAAPRPPVPSGVGLPSVVSGVPPPGYTRAVGVAWRPRASGAARSAANGSVRRGGGGRGGEPPRPGSRPRLSQADL